VKDERGGLDLSTVAVVKDFPLGLTGYQQDLCQMMHVGILMLVIEPLCDFLYADGTFLG
jgi:hypothetical protein